MLGEITKVLNEKFLRQFDAQLVRRSRLPEEYQASNSDERLTRRIIFFHAPKCGGTAVDHWLRLKFGGGAHLASIASREAAEALDIPMSHVREVLLAYAVRCQRNSFISGHYPFSERALSGKYDEFDMVTMLREPKARLLSHYYYNRFKENREHFGIDMELEGWLDTSRAKSAASVFATMFAGDLQLANPSADNFTPSSAQAIKNLRRFSIVGILEKSGEFEQKLRDRYNLKGKLEHLRANPGKNYPRFDDQPVHIKKRIEELCAIDSLIYAEFA